MKCAIKLYLTSLLLTSVAYANEIHISFSKNLNGEKIILSRVYGEIPDLGIKSTELTFPGTANKKSSAEICNQFLIPGIENSVISPKSLSPNCKVRAFGMSAFQCPGGTLSTTIIIEGSNCEDTIELFKSSNLYLTGTLTPEMGPDISNVEFFIE